MSVLTTASKLFEKVYFDQMYEYFVTIFSQFLSAFRKKYNCQHVLLRFVEDWRKSIEDKENFGAVLMDLSKAYDCLPHRLLLCKMHAYGVSSNACKLMRSYLQSREQRAKLGGSRSEWRYITKGVPQGSILGPLFFNIYVNDLFYYLERKCALYNYADDNTVGHSSRCMDELIANLRNSVTVAMGWFESNFMEANPTKFQAIITPYATQEPPDTIHVQGQEIIVDSSVKLLGVHFDTGLNFHIHISKLCAKVSRQLNALSRIAKYMDEKCRLNIFNAFITSNFSYCNIVWHSCSMQDIIKMEKLQKRALRIVFNDYTSPYKVLLDKANCESLYVSRLHAIAVEAYKCMNDLNPPFICELLVRNDTTYGLRDSDKVFQPRVRTDKHGINSFRYQCAKIWNSLPTNVKKCESLTEFKSQVRNWDITECTCGVCKICRICVM